MAKPHACRSLGEGGRALILDPPDLFWLHPVNHPTGYVFSGAKSGGSLSTP